MGTGRMRRRVRGERDAQLVFASDAEIDNATDRATESRHGGARDPVHALRACRRCVYLFFFDLWSW